ncbi:Uncharacterised protein [Serratia proteamaculans]|nr:Uncharacterised protein [Serratia proteamaculans]
MLHGLAIFSQNINNSEFSRLSVWIKTLIKKRFNLFDNSKFSQL